MLLLPLTWIPERISLPTEDALKMQPKKTQLKQLQHNITFSFKRQDELFRWILRIMLEVLADDDHKLNTERSEMCIIKNWSLMLISKGIVLI